ncbi:hypothetical protein JXA32_10800 [Candidatus Sumerlaeota bacterium]|nr:hypothetical protein [Candidatus Sumerlaeota bacterium]
MITQILPSQLSYLSHVPFLLFAMTLLSGCSTVRVATHKNAAFKRNESITVICKGPDTLGLTGELENLLLARGYDVISEDVARRLARTNIDVDLKDEAVRGDIDQYNATEVKSVYALTFNYSDRFDGALREQKITYLYGSLIDLRTGRILKSLKLKRSMWALKGNDAYLEMLIDQMEQ